MIGVQTQVLGPQVAMNTLFQGVQLCQLAERSIPRSRMTSKVARRLTLARFTALVRFSYASRA